MMRGLISALVVIGALLMLQGADAALIHGKDYQSPNGDQVVRVNSDGQVTQTLQAGEDQTNGVQKVEQQFSYQTPVAVDTQVKDAPGFVQMMKCMPQDNASVAGTIQLRDSLSAGAGSVVEEWVVLAVNYTLEVPIEFPVGKIFTTGIYLDFTTTSDIKCDVSYR